MDTIILKANNLYKEVKAYDKNDWIVFAMDGGRELLGTINGVNVIYWPSRMKECNQILGMATFDKEIVVDTEFLSMSDNGKLNILYHELRHVKEHVGMYTQSVYDELRKEYSKNNKVLPIELDADKYSYDKLGKDNFIEAMMEEFDIAVKYHRNTKEILRRVIYAKKYEVTIFN